MIEDTTRKKNTFEEYLRLRLEVGLNVSLNLIHRIDDSLLEQDLMTITFNLILVDDDLGNNLWGNTIIDRIIEETANNPELRSIPIFYYSAGTDIITLKNKSLSPNYGHLRCCSYDSLSDSVFEFIEENTVQIK